MVPLFWRIRYTMNAVAEAQMPISADAIAAQRSQILRVSTVIAASAIAI